MNILPNQIDEDQKYQQMAELFKGEVQNNCPASDLFEAYQQILGDLYHFRDFIEKANEHYLYDETRNQIKKYENLQKGIEWNKVYSIKYGLIYDEIYKFWRRVKNTVKRIYQERRQKQRKDRELQERQQVQRIQKAMNRLSLSNWKCYNNHKCILYEGKQTNRCNICRQKIEQKLLLRCNACDFDICEDCADNQDPSIVQKFYPSNTNPTTKTNTIVTPIKPKQEKIQIPSLGSHWACLKNHQLRQSTAHSSNVCNICWQKIGYQPQVRCQQCDFDVCNSCWTKKSPKLVNMYDSYFEPSECEKGHKMRPIHTYKTHSCDLCHKDLISEPFITCVHCDFDVCYTCNQEEQSEQEQDQPVYHQPERNKAKPKLCSEGHQAKLYPNGGAYRNGEFICSHCGKERGRVKAYHCPKCQWDLCNQCIIRLGYE